MTELTYEQTIELEKNIKIKNQANQIYKDFLENVKLGVDDYKDGKFKVWSDSHNAEYIKIDNDEFIFECKFLHEYYSLRISPSSIFDAIKQDYRGLAHLKSFITTSKK